MPLHSINLDEETEKIYKKVNKARKYGWFSREIQELLKTKYGTDKKILIQMLNDIQNQRTKLEDQGRGLAKRINKVK